MTELGALVMAVAETGKDSARLVLGDHLEEHGQLGRAEYIQASCAAPSDESAAARAEDLLAEHEGAWLGAWQDRLIDWDFKAGFVHGVRMEFSQFLRYGQELFHAEPVERLELMGEGGTQLSADEVREAVAHPAFQYVRDCAIDSASREASPGDWFRALAANPEVTRLRRFGPSDWGAWPGPAVGLDRESFSSFCRAGHLASLRDLRLPRPGWAQSMPPWLVEEIARARFAPELEALHLDTTRASRAHLRELAANPVFGALRTLELDAAPKDPALWNDLLESPNLIRLTSFSVIEDVLMAYARSPLATHINHLVVSAADRPLAPEERLAAWSTLASRSPRPVHLELRDSDPGGPAYRHLVQTDWLSELRSLSITARSGNVDFWRGRPTDLQELFREGALPALRELSIEGIGGTAINGHRQEGLYYVLRRWAGLHRLHGLELTRLDPGEEFQGALTPWVLCEPQLPIRTRVLGGVVLRGRDDVDRLLAWPGLAGLSRLGLNVLDPGGAPTAELADLSGQVLRDPRLGRLVELDLQLSGLDATPALQALADPGVLAGLRNVTVHGPTPAQLTAVRSRFGLRFRE